MDILDPRLLDPRLFLPFCPQTPELGSPPGPETPPRRKRSPELTRDHKLQIRTLHFIAGWTHKAILERLAPAEIPHLTLRQIRGACKAGPLTPQKPGRVGPKAKVTEEQKAQIKAFIEEDPKHRRIPWPQLPHYLEGFEAVRDAAIRRALRDLGYARKPRRSRIELTDDHKRDRLEWARAYEAFTPADWSQICFSDETWATGVSAYREWLTVHETEDASIWASLRQRHHGWMF